MTKRFLKEPLLHFLLLGVVLFLLHGYLNRASPDDNPSAIVVDRDNLLTYLQYRSRAFEPEHFDQVLSNMPADQLQQLIDEYIREEALYREARALQLGQNDYVARLRLIQQLEFITRGFLDSGVELTEDRIREYYEQHKGDYQESPRITFTHVFYDRERHGEKAAAEQARETLLHLNHERVSFQQAPAHGDRFPYHLNYVNRGPQAVADHFGADMQQRLFEMEPDPDQWRGPYRSPFGFHLVLVARNQPGRLPPLEEVRRQVERDAQRVTRQQRFEQAVKAIVDSYDVRVMPEVTKHSATGREQDS
ncbi:MAG: peptidylprolyl isomerase [Gammaproteobacteria bacterium]